MLLTMTKLKLLLYLLKSIANKSSNFISFPCDGCTDFSGDDMESIFIRICKNGKVEDVFFNIGEAESASSRDNFNYIMETFCSAGLKDTIDKGNVC